MLSQGQEEWCGEDSLYAIFPFSLSLLSGLNEAQAALFQPVHTLTSTHFYARILLHFLITLTGKMVLTIGVQWMTVNNIVRNSDDYYADHV